MSLKDRLKSKKEAKAQEKAETCEFKISIKKVTNAVAKTKDSSDLGNIVKEFAKFLSTIQSDNAKIVLSGKFDLGQRTLLNCILANFLEEGKTKTKVSLDEDEAKDDSKLIKKRKSIRSKIKASLQDEKDAIEEALTEEDNDE